MRPSCETCKPVDVDWTSVWSMEHRRSEVWVYIEHEDHCPRWSQGWFLSHYA